MRRGREALLRLAITVVVIAVLAGGLWLSGYNWDFRPLWRYRALYVEGLGRTLAATAAAFSLALVLGLGVALARLSRSLPIRHVGDLYVQVVRGTPFLAQVMIVYFGIAPALGFDDRFLSGTLALGVFGAAYVGEIVRAGIESIDRGQFEAARSLGLSRRQTLQYVVLPQALKRMIPPLTGEFVALTKESSLLFFIGFTEVMAVARQAGADTYRQFEAYLVVAAFYLTITIPFSWLAGRLERRLGRGQTLGVDL